MSDNQPMGYVLPSGIKQLRNDHPATIYAPDNAMVPGSHPVWLYDQPPAHAAVPEDTVEVTDEMVSAARAWLYVGATREHVQALWDALRSAAPAQPDSVVDCDGLAQFIRTVDGSHSMGAGVLAERICGWLSGSTK